MEAVELLQAIQALGETPKITISVEVKRAVGPYESVTGNAFLTFHLPAGTTNDEVVAEYARLYSQAHAIAEAEAEASVLRHAELKRQREEAGLEQAAVARETGERGRASTASTVTHTPPTPSPERVAAARAAVAASAGLPIEPERAPRQLTRAPKAEARVPGDWWEEFATHYAIAGKEKTNPNTGENEIEYTLIFSRDGLQGPVGTVFNWQGGWPDGDWFVRQGLDSGALVADGIVRTLPERAHLVLRVSDKVIQRTGNYRVDVTSVS